MKRLVLLFTLVLGLTLTLGAGHASTHALAGLGGVTPPGCQANTHTMPITGNNDGGPLWITVRPAALGLGCSSIVYGTPIVFVGEWDPTAGGCLTSYNVDDFSLCIGPVPHAMTPTTTTLSLCTPGQDCWPGSATLTR